MTATATIVWLAPEAPDAAQERVISAWAQAYGVALAPPADERPRPLGVDESLAKSVDDLIDRARDAVTEHDGAAADGALESAQQMLQAHPELPNAAWLLAEVERGWSLRFRRVPPTDDAAADRAWRRAGALDGGRIAGVGEVGATDPPRLATLVLAAPPGEEAWLDGSRVAASAVSSREGPHAVVVTWKGAPIWAAWIEATPGTASVPLPAPLPPPCSAADLDLVHASGGEVIAPLDVRCPRWIAVTTGLLSDALRVARCEGSRCGELRDWRAAPAWTWSPQTRPGRARWPAWGTWTLVGAGVAALAGVVVAVAAGSQATPAEARFVNGGLKSP